MSECLWVVGSGTVSYEWELSCESSVFVKENLNIKKRVYQGISETTFKENYSKCLKEGKYEKYCNTAELSKHIWELKWKNKFL